MNRRNKIWLTVGGGALAVVAAALVFLPPERPSPIVADAQGAATPTAKPATTRSAQQQSDETVRQQAVAAARQDSVDDWIAQLRASQSTLADIDGKSVVTSYGKRIKFARVADCSDTFALNSMNDWVPERDCGKSKLIVDHPYGEYSIAQLEYAANEMNDADAAYILAERFTGETWRERRDDAHAQYLKAFLLSSDAEIYDRMLGEMGIQGGSRTTDGELNVDYFAASYTMANVGRKFGVVGDERIASLAAIAGQSAGIDLEQLDREADEIYQSLLVAQEGLK